MTGVPGAVQTDGGSRRKPAENPEDLVAVHFLVGVLVVFPGIRQLVDHERFSAEGRFRFHHAEVRRDGSDDPGHQFGVLKLLDLPQPQRVQLSRRHIEPFVIGEAQIVPGNRPGFQPCQRCSYGTACVGRSASSGAGIDAAHAVSSPS